MSYQFIEPNLQQSISYVAHQIRESLGSPDCVSEHRATFAALQYALLRFGPLPVCASDADLVLRTICTHPNLALLPADAGSDARLILSVRTAAEEYIAETDCSTPAFRRAWNVVTEFIRSSNMKMQDQQLLDMLMYAITSGMNIMRYVLPRSGNTTLCDNLISMFPMRHFAVYSPFDSHWTVHSSDKRLAHDLFLSLRGSAQLAGRPRSGRSMDSALRGLTNLYPDLIDSLVVVFDAAHSSADVIERFARMFIPLNVQTIMLVSPHDRDVNMTQILTPTGRQSWLVNSD